KPGGRYRTWRKPANGVTEHRIRTAESKQMNIKRSVLSLTIASLLAMHLAWMPTPATAQIGVGVQFGAPPVVVEPAPIVVEAPPVCEWGYYDYQPYECAPYGFYGPEYFYGGIFLGVGPWFGWGYGHGWGERRFHGYHIW